MGKKKTSGVGKSDMRHNAYKEPSTYMPGRTSSNPCYDKVDDLWQTIHNVSTLDDMASIVMQFVKDGELDEEAYLSYVAENFGDDLEDLIDSFVETDEVMPAMPPAPSPKILYNRVADCEIVDVGSGDCNKLSLSQARKVVATDIEPQPNNHYTVKQLDSSYELRDFMEYYPGSVVTSFNSLTQLASVSQVEEFDGVHVLPDMEYVKATQVVHVDDRGVATYGEFRDRDNGILCDVVSEGYAVANTYQARNIRFEIGDPVIAEQQFPQVKNIYYKPPDVEATPKYDGTCMFLKSWCGKTVLSYRNGRGWYLEGGTGLDMSLMLEKLPEKGKPEAFVLLRVISFRGYYPFHGLNGLRSFCKQIKLRIGGVRLVAPGSPSLECHPADGLIFRIGQLDYRYKESQTVDLVDPDSMAALLEHEHGYFIEVEGAVEGLAEYRIIHRNGKYTFRFVRSRQDKVKTTPAYLVAEMMLWV